MTATTPALAELPVLGEKKRALERRIRAREFVFGIQDGLVSTVGLLSGVSAATQSRHIVVITGLAAAVTGGISMAAGSYLSSLTEKDIFEKDAVMFLSFVIGSILPLLPHLVAAGPAALPLSWAISVAALMGVGVFKGVLTAKPLVRSALGFAAVALGALV